MTDHNTVVVLTATQSYQVGSFKTRTTSLHNSTIWSFNLYNRLNAIINPNQRPRRTPLALFITITGTLCILRKANMMNSVVFSISPQMILVLGALQWTVVTSGGVPRVLSCELPVSCDLQLPKESATNTCRFDIGEPGLRPTVCTDRLDNTSHVHRIDVLSSFSNLTCTAMRPGTVI